MDPVTKGLLIVDVTMSHSPVELWDFSSGIAPWRVPPIGPSKISNFEKGRQWIKTAVQEKGGKIGISEKTHSKLQTPPNCFDSRKWRKWIMG